MRIRDWSSDVCSSDLVQHRATQSHLLAAEFAEGYRGDELATEDAAVMVEGLAGVAVEVEVGVGVFHRGLLLGPGGEAQDAPSCATTGRREGNRQAEAMPGLGVAGAASAERSWSDGRGGARWPPGREFAVARAGGVPRGLRLAGRRGEICPERTGSPRHGYCPRFFGRRHRRTR